MSILDRVFLGITAVVLLFLSGALAWTVWGEPTILIWLQSLRQSPQAFVDGGLLILFFLALAVYLGLLVSKWDNQKAVVHQTELGSVRISIQSVQDLTMRAVRQVKGIKDVHVSISEGESLKIGLDLFLYPDFHIPELTESVQERVRSYIQETVGITVGEVDVFVKHIASGEEKSRAFEK